MAEHWPPVSPWPSGGQIHCPFVSVDPTPADGWRSDEVTMRLREAYYKILQAAFDNAGIGWHSCLVQPKGNGALILVPPQVPPASLVEPLMNALLSGLRTHNRLHNEAARMRLRMAVHMGTVRFDPAGPAGHAIETLTKLADSPEFTAACTGELGFITSDYLYEDVIRHSDALIEPAMYQSIKATGLDGTLQGWAYMSPHLADPAVSVPRQHPVVGQPSDGWVPQDWGSPPDDLAGLSDAHRR